MVFEYCITLGTKGRGDKAGVMPNIPKVLESPTFEYYSKYSYVVTIIYCKIERQRIQYL